MCVHALRYHAVAGHNIGDVVLADRTAHRYRGLAVHRPRDLLVRVDYALGDFRQGVPNLDLELGASHEDAQLDVAVGMEDLRDDGARLVPDVRLRSRLRQHWSRRPLRPETSDRFRHVLVVDER